ncbi:phosphodiester glycosidase family protein [Streptomyces ochraceiscleroticus]|uniref:phosphodiester glycosidase family protein n=1 Tax=Streptomyces ochraceiscleroticus TaxID=47761 RepID=UPI0004CC56BB|nr:phosphodiester glycosidase family protein [Streptomyces ochraceiscleroticus]
MCIRDSLSPALTTVLAGTLAATFVIPGAAVRPADAAAPATFSLPKKYDDWQHDRLAPGVDLYQGMLAGRPGADHWTVTVRKDGAVLHSRETADALADGLRAAGFAPRTEEVHWPAGSDRRGTVGVRVRTGTYGGRDQADNARKELAAAGFDAVSEWTGGDGTPGTGLARVKVAVIDPRAYRGRLDAGYGTAVAGREKVTDMAARANALLAVNAGFFVMEEKDGVPGAAAGIAAYNGRLQSAATNGRIAAVLRGDGLHPEFRHLRTESKVTAGGATEPVDGINRVPGKVRNCGGTGGDVPTERPQHDVTCTDPDEIVRFTPELGDATPAGPGVEAVLNGEGLVQTLRPRGGPVPEGGTVLAGIGAGEGWLRDHAAPGSAVRLDEKITDTDGRPVRLTAQDDIVNGGPELVRDGRVAVDYAADGIEHAGDRSFAYTWGIRRNPRMVLGTDRAGRVILLTSAGRQPGYSDGLGLNEAAALIKSLGATQAMNLDGGGSVGMAVDGRLITTPSDATGERAVGDALLLTR